MENKLYTKLKTYDFESLFAKKGYAYFTQGEYNLNIIGVRKAGIDVTNLFDDYIVVIFKRNGKTCRYIYAATTDPGKYYMMDKLGSSKGTAILVPNQYRGCWELGKHKGLYKALVQKKPVTVYRDGNKDAKYDFNPEKTDKGVFGINIHRSSAYTASKFVNNWSAGCQVFASPVSYSSFIKYCDKQRELYGNSFTYTLLNEEDLI